MPDAFGSQCAQGTPDADRTCALARVRRTVQTSRQRLLEPGRELLGGITLFISAQTKRDHSFCHAFDRYTRGKIRPPAPLSLVLNVAHNIKHPAHLYPKVLARPLTSTIESRKIDIVRNTQRAMGADREGHF